MTRCIDNAWEKANGEIISIRGIELNATEDILGHVRCLLITATD